LIDMGDIVFNRNCPYRAHFGAKAATNASGGTHLPHRFSLLLGEAPNSAGGVSGNQLDEMVGTYAHAPAAGTTCLRVHLCPPVDQPDGFKLTGTGAGTKAGTAVGAGFASTPRSQCDPAAIPVAEVFIYEFRLIAGAGAFDEGNPPHSGIRLDAQHGSYLFRYLPAAHRAGGRRRIPIGDGLG
jgi:hypothetical protein